MPLCSSWWPPLKHWNHTGQRARVSEPNCARQSRSLLQEMSVLRGPWLTGAYLHLTCLSQASYSSCCYFHTWSSWYFWCCRHAFQTVLTQHLYIQFFLILFYTSLKNYTRHSYSPPSLNTWSVLVSQFSPSLCVSRSLRKLLKSVENFASFCQLTFLSLCLAVAHFCSAVLFSPARIPCNWSKSLNHPRKSFHIRNELSRGSI